MKVLPSIELNQHATRPEQCRYQQLIVGDVCREHLGLLSGKSTVDVSDPVSSAFYKGVWMKRATINTSMYEKVRTSTYLQYGRRL